MASCRVWTFELEVEAGRSVSLKPLLILIFRWGCCSGAFLPPAQLNNVALERYQGRFVQSWAHTFSSEIASGLLSLCTAPRTPGYFRFGLAGVRCGTSYKQGIRLILMSCRGLGNRPCFSVLKCTQVA